MKAVSVHIAVEWAAAAVPAEIVLSCIIVDNMFSSALVCCNWKTLLQLEHLRLDAQVVSDQVRLWQADTQRVRHQKAVLYDSFPTQQVYRLAAVYAQQHGWLLWQNDEQGRFVSQAGGHDQMRTYIKSIK